MNKCMLKDVVLILKDIETHMQKEPETLIVTQKLNKAINKLELLGGKNEKKITNQNVLKIISKFIDSLPSILNAIKNLLN